MSKNFLTLAENPFYSFSGEGNMIGQPSLWIRTFGCNLKCQGFGQKNPMDPSSYINPITFDPKSIKTLVEFPLNTVGCDSMYAHDVRFKHLNKKWTFEEIVLRWAILAPGGSFTGLHAWFTGGEPLLWQKQLVDFVEYLESSIVSHRHQQFEMYQIETNGKIEPKYFQTLNEFSQSRIHFNISPKLFSVSGEKDAVNYHNIATILNTYNGMLKFVVNDTEECWTEMDLILDRFDSEYNINQYDNEIFCMPCGSDVATQEDKAYLSKVVDKILARKLKVTPRAHINVFGNAVET